MTTNDGPLMRLRLRVGRRLVRPDAIRLLRHYEQAAAELEQTHPDRSDHCSYIAIGVAYVAYGHAPLDS